MDTTIRSKAGLTQCDAIPGPREAWRMSFDEIAIALSLADTGSERAAHLEQELRRRLAAGGRQKARHPAALWFLAGALVAITAFQLGAELRKSPPWSPISHGAVSASAYLAVRALPELIRN